MYTFINLLILLFTSEAVRSIALEEVFVEQSFHNFIFQHGYGCSPFQFKRKVMTNLKFIVYVYFTSKLRNAFRGLIVADITL